MADPLDDYLENLLSGTTDPKAALDQYLLQSVGATGSPEDVNRSGGTGSRGYSGPQPNYTPDAEGYIHGRAATFATPSDLANYARTGSLATGDNGIGAFGHNTTVTPGVAIARDVLTSVYGSPQNARGKTVHVVSPSGVESDLPIVDVGPASRNAGNNSVLELTPAATRILGSGDSEGYKFRFNL